MAKRQRGSTRGNNPWGPELSFFLGPVQIYGILDSWGGGKEGNRYLKKSPRSKRSKSSRLSDLHKDLRARPKIYRGVGNSFPKKVLVSAETSPGFPEEEFCSNSGDIGTWDTMLICKDSKKIVVARYLGIRTPSRLVKSAVRLVDRPLDGGARLASLAIAGYRVELVERGKERAKG
ncbi:hypothetical protein K0M31_006078 [Melipona bicolor]|uniref:Uncharacterized protein n=1 Tax=Melipona bicolor TaxID=60889 RepID=A0AA40FST1_9HYME|nr:hypothetical protein K0M31_006078 [Melipona bicolor]